jgi:3-oxoacyl-[acyl-carrier-protein] synthase II
MTSAVSNAPTNIGTGLVEQLSFPDDPATPVITSVGLVSVLGQSTSATWNALLGGRFISDHSRIQLDPADRESRVVALARQAAEQARTPHGFDKIVPPQRTAIVVATSKGSVVDWLAPPLHMADTTCVAGGLTSAGLGDISERLGHEMNIRGPRLTISAACASGLLALIRAAILIRDRQADGVLVVAAEASVHPMFVGTFRRLGVLAKSGAGCRPFDQHRDGFLMSEAAAAVWVQRAGDPAQLPSTPGVAGPLRLAIDGVALGGDATHLTGMDPSGRVLRRLIVTAIASQPVDVVHAHGTGTILNDQVELEAINAATATQQQAPVIYSHKAALGHSLGASGLVSAVLNYQMHSQGMIPPNVRTTSPIHAGRLRISSTAVSFPVTRSLAISAGFGGAMAAMAFKTI